MSPVSWPTGAFLQHYSCIHALIVVPWALILTPGLGRVNSPGHRRVRSSTLNVLNCHIFLLLMLHCAIFARVPLSVILLFLSERLFGPIVLLISALGVH